jgi:hypothetical protein
MEKMLKILQGFIKIMVSKRCCGMTPERRKCAIKEAPQKTSIAKQRFARHVSAATDWLVETKSLLRN